MLIFPRNQGNENNVILFYTQQIVKYWKVWYPIAGKIMKKKKKKKELSHTAIQIQSAVLLYPWQFSSIYWKGRCARPAAQHV